MKMIKAILIIIIVTVLLTSCGLDRSNPLDPQSNNITAPPLVTNLTLRSSEMGVINKFINLTWEPLTDEEADGYFIYRSRSYNGTYQRIEEIALDPTSGTYIDYNVTAGAYFYKISAYKYLNPEEPVDHERLEGPLNPSEYGVGINVPN